VVGLARSDASAAALTRAGATPHRGSTEDLESLRSGAAEADGVVHTAFFHAFSHASLPTRLRVILGGSPRGIANRFLRVMIDTDRRALETLAGALDAGQPLVAAFGTMALTPGRLATEDDAADPRAAGGVRGENEAVLTAAAASRGVRTSILRLPPVVHGDGDHGFAAQIITAARRHGVSGYPGDGHNRWPAVHRLDAADLFVRALEKGEAGSCLHGVAEEGVPFIDVATVIGRRLGVPVATATPQEVRARFGFIAPFIVVDNPVSSALTRARLGWEPTRVSLLEDLEHGTYITG